ncbi:MAG: arsenic efflux protein [Oscillospiraceae bacterium]|nr:arsenic efflux protein [Oscillospiraceae bacterium]
MDTFVDILLDTLLDTAKALPLLAAVYLLAGWLEHRAGTVRLLAKLPHQLDVVAGALAGCIPQCGFSAAAASLYQEGFIGGAALVAVFLSTSDEALPVLLGSSGNLKMVALLIAAKLAIAIGMGFLLKAFVFRQETLRVADGDAVARAEHQADAHSCCGQHGFWKEALLRTLKIAAFLAAVLFFVNLGFELVGEERLGKLLLSGSFLQPLLCTLIGMIPSCGSSVLLTELYLAGGISFGSAVAGLSAGAGFGYLVLLRGDKKKAIRVIGWTFVTALAAGFLMTAFS